MDRDLQIGIGITLIGLAFGTFAYFGYKYLKSSSGGGSGVTLQLQNNGSYLEAVVSWTDGTKRTVQVATVQNGVVTGHFFNSEANAKQASQDYASGNTQAAAAMAISPADRLAMGTGSATLYVYDASVSTYAQGGIVYAWTKTGDDTSALIVNDSTGVSFSSLKKPDTSQPT